MYRVRVLLLLCGVVMVAIASIVLIRNDAGADDELLAASILVGGLAIVLFGAMSRLRENGRSDDDSPHDR
jgi:hypothetical protein